MARDFKEEQEVEVNNLAVNSANVRMLCIASQSNGWKDKGMDVEGTFLQRE